MSGRDFSSFSPFPRLYQVPRELGKPLGLPGVNLSRVATDSFVLRTEVYGTVSSHSNSCVWIHSTSLVLMNACLDGDEGDDGVGE